MDEALDALGEGGYSNTTMLVETLRALIFLLLWHKTGKKLLVEKIIFLSLIITCQKLK